jgi:hypothetical protein
MLDPDKVAIMEIRKGRLAESLAAAILLILCWPSVVLVRATVALPVEVVGEDGTTGTVTVDVPARRASEVQSLWMQIHNLGYADLASVQVNTSAWVPLNNTTVAVAEPGKSYGGIGGGFSTLSLTLALPAGAVVGGTNTIRFRFNRTDGFINGFRVVDFNLLTADSGRILDPDVFTREDPETWTPPLRDPDSLRAGLQLWQSAPLKASTLPNAPMIRAHCADCHAQDGRDLKYFAFSNTSIVARSRFHGLSDLEGRQIASYIRALPVTSPGRPWNPPYQPGPGLDAKPVANWAAGAGLSGVLENDSATLPFIFGPQVSHEAFRPDGNLNPREIPISLQLPDWSHWLPRVHPVDAWGAGFEKSEFAKAYASAGGSKQSLRSVLASPDLPVVISSGRIVTSFEKWTNARRAFLKPYVEGPRINWTPDLAQKAYSTQLWQLVKSWEMAQEFGLEDRGREFFGETGESRTWFNSVPAETAPSLVNIPDGPSGMGGSALTNEYFDASWYQLQVLLNSGNHRHRGREPVDWIYQVGKFYDLYRESQRPEPARLLVTMIKAMQSTDPRVGPDDVLQGWRPAQNVDPTIMVSANWAPMFAPLPRDAKRAITESFLTAWLDKNLQYPVGQYFRVGAPQLNYALPASYGSIAGGKPWEAAPLFLAAGVNPEIVKRLQKWGATYGEMAARFQYAPGKAAPPKKGGGGTR